MRIALTFLLFLIFPGLASAQVNSPSDIPVEAFAALPRNSSVQLSPNGENVLYISAYGGNRVVAVMPLTSNSDFEGIAVPPLPDMDIRWARWANDEYILISMSFEAELHSIAGKQIMTRLISVPIHNPKKAKNMAQPRADRKGIDKLRNANAEKYSMSQIQDYVIDILPDDPDHFLLGFDEDMSDWAKEVRKVSVKRGTYRLVHDPSGVLTRWKTDQQGQVRLGYGSELVGTNFNSVEDQIMYRNPETGIWKDYTGETIADFDDFFVVGFTEDPRFAYLYALNDYGFNGLFIYDMIDLKVTETLLSFEDRDVVGIETDPYTGNIVGAMYHDNGNKYVYFDENYKKVHSMVDKALPGSYESLTSRTADGKRYLVYSDSDVDSGSYYIFDTETRQMAFLQAKYPGLDPALMSPMKGVTYTARDGMEIPGYLTIPLGKEAKNLPTIILPHGGPTARDYWGFDYLVQFLASRGYAVLQPNFRGSTGYGEDFEQAGKREWGLKMQDDVTDGAMWLVKEGIADPDRMCIFGWSYGGYAALAATFTTPDLFQCAVSVNGISDLYRLVTQESNYLGLEEWGEEIGDPQNQSDKARMKATSAIENIDKIRMPVLLLANNDDTTVNYQQSKRFYDKMRKAGKYVEYVEMPEGNHSARNEPSQLTILSNLERFLARYIGKGN